MKYSICFVVTNGKAQKRFLHVTRSGKGFYFAFGSKGGSHFSYHSDGNTHFVFDAGVCTEDTKRTPLDQIRGVECFQGIGSVITDETLEDFKIPELGGKQYDSIVYVDNRATGLLHAMIYLVEPNKHGDIPIIKSTNTQVFLFTGHWRK